MQQFDIYLRAASVKAALVDQFNNANSAKVSLTRGMQAELVLYLFHTSEEDSKYTAEELSAFVAWNFCADSDYDLKTTPKLRVSSGITVAEDGGIHIPVLETNTEEVIAYLGNSESKDLKCELVGMTEGETIPDFCLQWEISIRNRIGGEGTGQPTPVEDGNYTAAQVNAILAAPNEVEYTADGETWTADCPPGATHRRYKNSAVSGAVWTVESLVRGADGSVGSSGATFYPYVAYASNNAGADFSLIPTDNLKYKAEFFTSVVISAPVLDDFNSAGATWIKYIGDNGSNGKDGNGDMSTSDFVSAGGTGVVVSAAHANSAGAVAWENVTGKIDRARQTLAGGSNTLFIDTDIISCTSNIANGALQIDFPNIRNGASAYTGKAGDIFTWEYHIRATAAIGTITVGSSSTIKPLDSGSFPQELPLIGGHVTLHVFTVRGRYKSGAVNNLSLIVNHAYSEEE